MERRLNTWINTDAYLALEMLADRYGVTRRGLIEVLLARELEKPRALKAKREVVERRVLKSETGSLRRNESRNAASHVAVPVAVEERRIEELLRNESAAVADPDKNNPAPVVEPQPSRPAGAQFELEL